MAVVGSWYGLGLLHCFEADIDWASDTIKVLITDDSYTPDQDTHESLDDITNEVSGTGYTTGGKSLTSRSLVYNASPWPQVNFYADDLTWTTVTFTDGKFAVIYKSSGSSATSWLIGWIDMDTLRSPVAEDFNLVWDADGILWAVLP